MGFVWYKTNKTIIFMKKITLLLSIIFISIISFSQEVIVIETGFHRTGDGVDNIVNTTNNIVVNLSNDIINIDAVSGNKTVELPSPSLCKGKEITINKIDNTSNKVIIKYNNNIIKEIIIISEQKILSTGKSWYIE